MIDYYELGRQGFLKEKRRKFYYGDCGLTQEKWQQLSKDQRKEFKRGWEESFQAKQLEISGRIGFFFRELDDLLIKHNVHLIDTQYGENCYLVKMDGYLVGEDGKIK